MQRKVFGAARRPIDRGAPAQRRKRSKGGLTAVIASLVALFALALAADAQAARTKAVRPGTRPAKATKDKTRADVRSGDPLLPFATESGDISLSVDGIGTNEPTGAPVKVYKEFANETVRKAYLFAASTGSSNFNPEEDSELTLEGNPIPWNSANTISSDIGSVNAEANVTSLVEAQLNAAPAGYTELNIAEGQDTAAMDGEILAVIFNNPNLKEPNSVTLLYGAQNPFGDTFHVGLAEPIDKSKAGFALNLSLGISFGYQTSFETSQFSEIHVNGKLMTQMAGGQDDCVKKYEATPDFSDCENGELLTVGGVGDTPESANPNETLAECAELQGEPVTRCSNEDYNLLNFVENGESELNFETLNPSDNDNIFFGALETHANAAVVGEGITLAPTAATNNVGEEHTLTATVQNENGEKLSGKQVHFEVISGPNEGTTGEGTTNGEGRTTFTYGSVKAGTDHIVATFSNAESETETSNEVTETWEEEAVAKKGCAATGPALDSITSGQRYNQATANVSTTTPGDLLVAFVAADSPWTGGQTSTVTGGGLEWTLVGRENGALGDAEIWEARATGTLTETPISALVNVLEPGSPGGEGYDETITVAAFKNASGIGNVSEFWNEKGAPTGTVQTTQRCTWVWAIGDDWLASVPRIAPFLLQKVWAEAYDKVGDTYWVQSRRFMTFRSGATAKINDLTPTKDPYNLVLADIL